MIATWLPVQAGEGEFQQFLADVQLLLKTVIGFQSINKKMITLYKLTDYRYTYGENGL